MKISYLDFEKPISELESQTEKLKETHEKNKNLDISKELTQLELKTEKLLHEIYDNLNAWQISQVSRHPQRPYTLDYIDKLFEDFEELHGDRAFADDPAMRLPTEPAAARSAHAQRRSSRRECGSRALPVCSSKISIPNPAAAFDLPKLLTVCLIS